MTRTKPQMAVDSRTSSAHEIARMRLRTRRTVRRARSCRPDGSRCAVRRRPLRGRARGRGPRPADRSGACRDSARRSSRSPAAGRARRGRAAADPREESPSTVSVIVPRRNGCAPVSISYSDDPEREEIGAHGRGLAENLLGRDVARSAQEDARLGHEAVSCATVPSVGRRRLLLARPKSRIFTRPSRVMKMFSGFRSRCTMPRSCAAASPRAI